MNFLSKLFGGGQPDDKGYYFYVRPKMCKEIVEVRIDLANQLSQQDDGDGYWVRKMVSATRCPFQAEAVLYFDSNKRETGREIENGEFVTKEAYLATQNPEA